MTVTMPVPEPNEIGSYENPHKFGSSRNKNSVSLLLRTSDLHHVLIDRLIVIQSSGLMRRLESRVPDPSLPRSGRMVLCIPVAYGALLGALSFLHHRSTRPADVVAGEMMCAGEKALFDHAEKAFVHHLAVGQLEPLLEAAQVLEVEPLVDMIRERISFSKEYSRAVIQTVLGSARAQGD